MKIAKAKIELLETMEGVPKVDPKVKVHPFGPPFEYPKEIPRDHKLVRKNNSLDSSEIMRKFPQKLIDAWWKETDGGKLGKPLDVGDYVYVDGFCSLDFDRMKKPKGQINFEEMSFAKLVCNATSVTVISEKDYNDKLHHWIGTFVDRRYNVQRKKFK